jgi:hypothetical protein
MSDTAHIYLWISVSTNNISTNNIINIQNLDCGILYSLVGNYQHFGGTCYLQGACSSIVG